MLGGHRAGAGVSVRAGDYQEEIFGKEDLVGVVKDADARIAIPKNCGRIWTTGS